jgi:hypothetical protein
VSINPAGAGFFYSPGCDRAYPGTSEASGSLLAPEPGRPDPRADRQRGQAK